MWTTSLRALGQSLDCQDSTASCAQGGLLPSSTDRSTGGVGRGGLEVRWTEWDRKREGTVNCSQRRW